MQVSGWLRRIMVKVSSNVYLCCGFVCYLCPTPVEQTVGQRGKAGHPDGQPSLTRDKGKESSWASDLSRGCPESLLLALRCYNPRQHKAVLPHCVTNRPVYTLVLSVSHKGRIRSVTGRVVACGWVVGHGGWFNGNWEATVFQECLTNLLAHPYKSTAPLCSKRALWIPLLKVQTPLGEYNSSLIR